MRMADGTEVALHDGMRVPVDARILTDKGAAIILQADGVPAVILGQNTDMLVTSELAQAHPVPADHAVAAPADPVATQVLAALDAGPDPFSVLDPTAAVLTGGGGGGASFTRLASIIEPVTPLDLAYPRPGVETPEFVQLGGAVADAEALAAGAGGSAGGNDGGDGGDDCGCGDKEVPPDADRVQNNLVDHGWAGGASSIYGKESGGNNLAGDYEVGMTIGHGTVDKHAGDDLIYGGGKDAAGNNLYGDYLVSSAVVSSGGDLELNISGGKDALCDSSGSGSQLYGDFVRIGAVQAFDGDVAVHIKGGSDTIQGGDGGGNVIYGDRVEIGGLQSANGHQASVHVVLGNDVIQGGSGDDTIYGDHVSGANQAGVTVEGGNDTLRGGAGNDTLWGGYGDDTFVWKLGDQGTTGNAAVDTIKDFGTGIDHLGQDTLNLSDLLKGHAQGSDLTEYLDIQGDGHATIIDVKVNADGSVADHVTQRIVIDNVDLTAGHANLNTPEGQADLINSLIQQGKLNVDHH